MRLFRESVFLIDGSAVGLEVQVRAIDPRDAVIVVSFAPYSREALFVADQVRSVGATLVAFTDSGASPLARDAQAVLQFEVTSPSFFPSVAAGVALSEALLERLVADGGDAVVNRIEKVEQGLFDSGIYVRPGRRRSG
jgi:DNA-binding MurR/RpiR family transcriptional regulator